MRNFIFFLLTTIVVFGKENVEMFAGTVVAKKNLIIATDSVVVLYANSMIRANKAIYNKKDSILALEGRVEMIDWDDRIFTSEKLVINTQNRSVDIESLFLSGEEDLWINALNANKRGEVYKLYDSKLSSCDRADPDWTIEFEEANYYKEQEFITMEGARLRFYDTTIFYLPYLALPTLNKRTTGLLFPTFKLSDREGFFYQQPIFYVPADNWDVEFDPQIRTKRGMGSFVTTRFVDSNHSKGFIRIGYFRNSNDYVRRNDLNREHWGGELYYESENSLSFKDYNSAFYFNGTYLNDREYLNLQKDSVSSLVSSNLIESRLNAILYNKDNYFAFYGRYNIDTSKENNNETIQNIPSLQYHHYMKQISDSSFFYSFDSRLHNYTRVEGSRASQIEIDVPLTYYHSFFDDFFDISLSENLYLSKVVFRNLTEDDNNQYYYYRNYHTFKFSSDLTKKYGNSLHNITPSITYIKPSIEKESPTAYRKLEDEKRELFVRQTQEEQLSFALSQHYFDENLEMNLFHRFGYTIFPEREESKGDFNNEVGYNKDDIRFYSNLIYSWNRQRVRSMSSSIGYNKNNYDIMLIHFYNHDFLYDNKKTSFLQSELTYHPNDKNSWFVNFDYDLEENYNHQWKFGWSHKQKCWSAKISLGQEIIPNIDDSFRNTALYLELNLNPLGGIEQNIEEDFSSKGN